jgi:DNA-binding MarR family transcriptional regulator
MLSSMATPQPRPLPLGALLIRPAFAMRTRIQRAIEAAGFDDFRLAHQNVFAWVPPSGIRLGELARRAQLSKQTMSELVAYLEAHGYVERARDPTDGRAWIIRRSSRGDAVDGVAQQALLDTQREWASVLGENDFQVLLELLRRLLPLTES